VRQRQQPSPGTVRASAGLVSATAGSLALPALIGLAVGALLCVLNVLVLLKTGAAVGGSALVVLLGAAALRAFGRLTWPSLFVVFSTASSGYLATAALDSGVAAVYLTTGEVPPWLLLVGLALLANAVGAVIGARVAGSFAAREELPYPTLQPAISLMRTMTTQAAGTSRTLLVAAVAGGAVALAASAAGLGVTPSIPGLPGYLAVAVSPLLLGVGMLIGARSAAWLFAGCAYSVVVWLARDAASPGAGASSFTAHLADPWVIAVGVGLVLGCSLATLAQSRRSLSAALRAEQLIAGRRIGQAMVAGVALVPTVALIAWRGTWPGLALGTLTAAVVLLAALFLNRAGAEIGIAPLAPVLYLTVVLFAALGLPPSDAVLLAATVCCAAIASVYYVYAVKVGESGPSSAASGATPQAAPRGRAIAWTQAAGGTLGAVVGVTAIIAVIEAGVLGGEQFPAPVAAAVGFVAAPHTVATAAGLTVVVAAVAAGLVGVGLTVAVAVPTTLGLGVLLPPSYALAIAAGGLARRWWSRQERNIALELVASGLVMGDGLVMVVVLGWRAFAGPG
jgi:hypothetical protein